MDGGEGWLWDSEGDERNELQFLCIGMVWDSIHDQALGWGHSRIPGYQGDNDRGIHTMLRREIASLHVPYDLGVIADKSRHILLNLLLNNIC